MTADEIAVELEKLDKTSKEFDERGALLMLTALGQREASEPAFQWLAGQWVTGFSSLPILAKESVARQYDLVLHIFGTAHAMRTSGFPAADTYLAHATEIKETFERIVMLENMLADIKEGIIHERLH